MATIYSFENEEIVMHKEQQMFLLERVRTSTEIHEYHHKKFMADPSKENELKALKSFEHMTYDLNNLKLHQKREMEERLRVANELLKKHNISLA